MKTTSLHIKNIVCPRCISTVQRVLTNAGLQVKEVRLGEASIQTLEAPDLDALNNALEQEGFALIYDREKQLSEKLNISYQQLSKIFSRQENTTIEKFFIKLKIEKVKELLSYHQLTLSEIAFRLKYSSVQHLSNQFKKVTGQSVSEYKQADTPPRTSLDALI